MPLASINRTGRQAAAKFPQLFRVPLESSRPLTDEVPWVRRRSPAPERPVGLQMPPGTPAASSGRRGASRRRDNGSKTPTSFS